MPRAIFNTPPPVKTQFPSAPDSWEAKLLNFGSGLLGNADPNSPEWEKGGKWGDLVSGLVDAAPILGPAASFILKKPLKAYHGTKSVFDYFNPRKYGHPGQPGSKWIHAGMSPKEAEIVAKEGRSALGDAAARGYTDENLSVVPIELPEGSYVHDVEHEWLPRDAARQKEITDQEFVDDDLPKRLERVLQRRLKAIDRVIERKGSSIPVDSLDELNKQRQFVKEQLSNAPAANSLNGMSFTSHFDPEVARRAGVHAVQYPDTSGQAIAFPPEKRLKTPWGVEVTKRNLHPRTMRGGGNVPYPKPKHKVVQEVAAPPEPVGTPIKITTGTPYNFWLNELDRLPPEEGIKANQIYTYLVTKQNKSPQEAAQYAINTISPSNFDWSNKAKAKLGLLNEVGAQPPRKGFSVDDVEFPEPAGMNSKELERDLDQTLNEPWDFEQSMDEVEDVEELEVSDPLGLDAPKPKSGMKQEEAFGHLGGAILKGPGNELEKDMAMKMANTAFVNLLNKGTDPLEAAHSVNTLLFGGKLDLPPMVAAPGSSPYHPLLQKLIDKIKPQFSSLDPTEKVVGTWNLWDPDKTPWKKYNAEERANFLKGSWGVKD